MNRRRLMVRGAGASPVLPAEYQRVEWIRNMNSTAGFTIPVQNFSKIDFDIEIDTFAKNMYQNPGGNYIIFGNTSNALSIGVTSTYGRMFIYSSSATGVYDFNYYSKTVNIKAGLDANAVNKRYFNVTDGETIASSSQNLTESINISNINTIYLFSLPNSANTHCQCRLKKLRMNTNIANYDLIPCYRKSDNAIGLYDTINGTFYVSSGTFEKGADV